MVRRFYGFMGKFVHERRVVNVPTKADAEYAYYVTIVVVKYLIDILIDIVKSSRS